MARYAYDTETDGLLPELTVIHSLVLRDLDTGERISCADQPGYRPIREGLALLAEAELIVGHNTIKFDEPAINKVHPTWKSKATRRDTIVLSRLIWPEIKKQDFLLLKRLGGIFPKNLIGKHSLEAWGYRIRNRKVDYKDWCKENGIEQPFAIWRPEMQSYCEQDVDVTFDLWHRIAKKNYSEQAIEIEHQFAMLIGEQERHGFGFDERAAGELYATLAERREALKVEATKSFGGWWRGKGTNNGYRKVRVGCKVKRPDLGTVTIERFSKKGKRLKPYVGPVLEEYVAGGEFTAIEWHDFNPMSRDDIIDRLTRVRGWEPTDFTEKGKPEVNDEVLGKLVHKWPEVKPLSELFLLQKRIGQVAEGNSAWMKLVRGGRVYGSVITNGAVTRRCTHKIVVNIPRVTSPYGKELRGLFVARPGHKLVGADASSLELRCLAHYMARYDEGAYAKAVVEGKQSEGTDVHTLNAIALGLDPKGQYNVNGRITSGRDIAKTFIYAFLYGAGDEKIGLIVGVTEDEIIVFQKNRKKLWSKAVWRLQRDGRTVTPFACGSIVKGALLKQSFLTKTPALAKLREAVVEKVDSKGILYAIDRGRLEVRSSHSALNTLLQSAGAIAVKQATVLFGQDLSTRGWQFGREWALCAHMHDEMQVEVMEGLEDEVGRAAVAAFQRAGEKLGFRCPLSGEYNVGRNWAETH